MPSGLLLGHLVEKSKPVAWRQCAVCAWTPGAPGRRGEAGQLPLPPQAGGLLKRGARRTSGAEGARPIHPGSPRHWAGVCLRARRAHGASCWESVPGWPESSPHNGGPCENPREEDWPALSLRHLTHPQHSLKRDRQSATWSHGRLAKVDPHGL